MKIYDFITKYDLCPLCLGKIDCIVHIDLKHTFAYNISDNFIFIKVNSRVGTCGIKNCVDCYIMPDKLQFTDRFITPKGLQIKTDQFYGDSYLRIECINNDFSMISNGFSIFSDIQNPIIDTIEFSIDRSIIILNNYNENKTIITALSDCSYTSKEINLIPIDKWPLDDKIKLRDKVNKLLVLM